jgi:hypothetical protein
MAVVGAPVDLAIPLDLPALGYLSPLALLSSAHLYLDRVQGSLLLTHGAISYTFNIPRRRRFVSRRFTQVLRGLNQVFHTQKAALILR